jgi:hypothetical protein
MLVCGKKFIVRHGGIFREMTFALIAFIPQIPFEKAGLQNIIGFNFSKQKIFFQKQQYPACTDGKNAALL